VFNQNLNSGPLSTNPAQIYLIGINMFWFLDIMFKTLRFVLLFGHDILKFIYSMSNVLFLSKKIIKK